jgi:hypothetical protein
VADGTHREQPEASELLAGTLDDAGASARSFRVPAQEAANDNSNNNNSHGGDRDRDQRQQQQQQQQQPQQQPQESHRTDMSTAGDETPRVGSSAYATSPGTSAPSTARNPPGGGERPMTREGGTGYGALSSERSERSGGGSDRFDDRPRTSPERPASVPPVPIGDMGCGKNKPPLGPGSGSRDLDRDRRGNSRGNSRDRNSRDRDQARDGERRGSSRGGSRDRSRGGGGGGGGGGKENRGGDRDSNRSAPSRRRHPDDYDSDDLSPASDSEVGLCTS